MKYREPCSEPDRAPWPVRPTPGGRFPGPHTGAFTLVEAVVSLLVMMVLLGLALPLVIESLRLLDETGRRALAQDRWVTLAWLRRDLELASSVAIFADGRWREQPLVLLQGDTRVEWRVEGAELWRLETRTGQIQRRRRLLGAIEAWRLRSTAAIVEIELRGVGAARPAVIALASGTPRRGETERLWVEHLVVRPKGGGRQGSW